MEHKSPNILFLMTDQQNFRTLSCMGHPLVKTPNIDRLAEHGIVFTDAYTPGPICGPARSAILTGEFPPSCGGVTNWVPLDGNCILMPEHLQNSGYRTAHVGKLHLVPHLKRFGFQWRRLNDAPYSVYANDSAYSDYVTWLEQTLYKNRPGEVVRQFDEDEAQWHHGNVKQFMMGGNFIDEQHHMSTWTADRCLEFLDQHDTADPFFLHVGWFGPHQPFDVPEPWRSMIDPAEVELPESFAAEMSDHPVFNEVMRGKVNRFRGALTEDDYREMIAVYLGNVMMIDHHIGRVFDRLERDGVWDDTMVVFTADHGDHQGRYGSFIKGDMYDGSVRVPLVVKPAGRPKPPRRCRRVVSTLDLYGTVLDAAGNTDWRTDRIECESLFPLVDGCGDPGTDDPGQGRARSIIGENPDRNQVMLRDGWLKMIRAARGDQPAVYELYDHRTDPLEMVNLFDDPQYAEPCRTMRQELDAWWSEQREKYPPTLVKYTVADDPRANHAWVSAGS